MEGGKERKSEGRGGGKGGIGEGRKGREGRKQGRRKGGERDRNKFNSKSTGPTKSVHFQEYYGVRTLVGY